MTVSFTLTNKTSQPKSVASFFTLMIIVDSLYLFNSHPIQKLSNKLFFTILLGEQHVTKIYNGLDWATGSLARCFTNQILLTATNKIIYR